MYPRIRGLREDKDWNQGKMRKNWACHKQDTPSTKTGENDVPSNILIKLSRIQETSVNYLLGLTDEHRPYGKKNHVRNFHVEEQIQIGYRLLYYESISEIHKDMLKEIHIYSTDVLKLQLQQFSAILFPWWFICVEKSGRIEKELKKCF